jgi:hypothetical protein
MANAVFEHYNAIMGTPFQRTVDIDLDVLGLQLHDLTMLDVCFSEFEIWATITELPSDKALGPDGFTGLFYKLSWPIIKADVINVFNVFWTLDGRSFNLINEAFMVLLRKKSEPVEIKDYRPISLMHRFGKLVTKCLARRLALVLNELVHPSQSAFIQGGSIHDNLRAVHLTCKALQQSRRSHILLKIDIAKAFDSVGWPFLLEVLRRLGFSRRWRDWMSLILGTSSTKVLLNGRPGERICHARGLRQGDPLSPMLFVLVMEVFGGLVRWCEVESIFTPLHCAAVHSRVSLYADDVVMFVIPADSDLIAVRTILRIFGDPSGLYANMDKCVATPINCTPEDLQRVTDRLACSIGAFWESRSVLGA